MSIFLLGSWVRTVKQDGTHTQVSTQNLFLKQMKCFYIINFAKIKHGMSKGN